MKTKKILSVLLAAALATSFSLPTFAVEIEASDSPTITNTSAQPKSFYRSFAQSIDGRNETKVAWDINAYGDRNYRITLNDTVKGDVQFRLEIDNESIDFQLSPGGTWTYTADNGASFSLFATFVDNDMTGTCKGTISLGNL